MPFTKNNELLKRLLFLLLYFKMSRLDESYDMHTNKILLSTKFR